MYVMIVNLCMSDGNGNTACELMIDSKQYSYSYARGECTPINKKPCDLLLYTMKILR